MHLSELTTRLAGKRIAVIGDLVADQFLSGTISRVSREAPVFILRHDETETRPGGAANAAVNIASLGGEPLLVGLIGHDSNGSLLIGELRNGGVSGDLVVRSQDRSTTTKVRVLAGQHYAARQQVIRIDYENGSGVDAELQGKLMANVKEASGTADAVVVSDYGYGVVTKDLFDAVSAIARSRGIPLIADSRFRLEDLHGATSATPNQEEVEKILGTDLTVDGCHGLRDRLGLQTLLVTRGNKGMLLLENGRSSLELDAVGSKEPVDVTGAGDTVIAAYSLAIAAGLSFAEAAEVANHAGGIVVMKKRTATVTPEELIESMRSANPAAAEAATAPFEK